MTPPSRFGGSLLERAVEHYGLDARRSRPVPAEMAGTAPAPAAPEPVALEAVVAPDKPRAPSHRRGQIDRIALAEGGYLLPDAPVTALAEEFRMVKRQLLLGARSVKSGSARMILVCSANPEEGKSFCAINLAMSLAAERDTRVLLVDGDFAKPDIVARLGLEDGPGLLDALADPAVDVEACVIDTDVAQLAVLPAGAKQRGDTELLSSARTAAVLDRLLAADPRRILVFDSPPALAASPATVLASHAGQVMMVVRADRTTESDLREAVGLLDGCDQVQLLINAVAYAPGRRRLGSYYGVETTQ